MELKNRGIRLNHKTVLKLMNELGLCCKIRRKRYNSYHGDVVQAAPNILQCNFKAKRPSQKWTTDITEFALLGKKVYLSPVLDLYNSEVIAYSISLSPNMKMIHEMLDKAFITIPDDTELVFHQGRQGWQYLLELLRKRK